MPSSIYFALCSKLPRVLSHYSPPPPPPFPSFDLFFFCVCGAIRASRLLEVGEKGEGGGGKLDRIATEIRALEYISRRSAEASGRRRRGKEGVKFRTGRGGEVQATEVSMSRRVETPHCVSFYSLLFHVFSFALPAYF